MLERTKGFEWVEVFFVNFERFQSMIKWIIVCLKKRSFKRKCTRRSRGVLWKRFEFINKEAFEKDEKVLKIKEWEKNEKSFLCTVG